MFNNEIMSAGKIQLVPIKDLHLGKIRWDGSHSFDIQYEIAAAIKEREMLEKMASELKAKVRFSAEFLDFTKKEIEKVKLLMIQGKELN